MAATSQRAESDQRLRRTYAKLYLAAFLLIAFAIGLAAILVTVGWSTVPAWRYTMATVATLGTTLLLLAVIVRASYAIRR